ncbi:GRB2-related adapter protein 2b [Genypterus blacodes]|uniref:GRB2-related adapter protein 2b n=1 Tax=Genypterus blacodes TaxID=154954 RepID=UPI003F75D08D
MEATAKFDFQASADDELGFTKGDQLIILQASEEWYKAELRGVQGFVPQNFVDVQLPSWYQEDASRSDAQEQLMAKPLGAFLIRGSKSGEPGDLSLSVRHAADVQHFKVMRNKRGQFFLWSEMFRSLNGMVQYYKEHSISKQSQILLLEEHQQQQRQQQQQRGVRDKLPMVPSSRPDPEPQQHESPSLQQVKALYSFQAEEEDELEFQAGDIIEVLESSGQGWWRGQLGGRIGLFPGNYTADI